jgi:short-subunit dehydrogenase
MNATSTVLITGAGRGIGRALACVLAQQGYAIAALDVREEGLRSLADELQTRQQRIAWGVADVTEPAGLNSAVRELEAKLGPTDVLVANAGVAVETPGVDYNVENMNKIINVNLIGVSNSIGAVLPGMMQRKRGHLVAISSMASYRGLPRMLGYCASKAGVNSLMDGLRVELMPHGIAVTTICPSWIKTAMTENLEGELEQIMGVEDAVREIAYAINRKLAFYAFPRKMRWRLGFLTLLPRSWQDRYIRRIMDRFQMKKKT